MQQKIYTYLKRFSTFQSPHPPIMPKDMRRNSTQHKVVHQHKFKPARRNSLEKKIDSYIDSFTIHGLTRSIKGKKIESIFWSTILFLGVIFCFYIIHGLYKKFNSRAVYTEIRFQITEQNYFPSITFCDQRLVVGAYFSYCGESLYNPHWDHIDVECGQKGKEWKEAKITDGNGSYWSNGLFNVTMCVTWGGKFCTNKGHFTSMRSLNNSCITWNYKGALHDLYSHAQIEFQYHPPPGAHTPKMVAVLHDHAVKELDITRKVSIDPHKQYNIKVDKTYIKRLPAPFPSNCTNGKGDDIFPGKYSRQSCIESHNFIEMYKRCGDTIDHARGHIPAHIKARYGRNATIREMVDCITTFGVQEVKQDITGNGCRFPCEDLDLNIVSTTHDADDHDTYRSRTGTFPKYEYLVSVQLQRVDTYKIMEEKELYTWDQMACEVGGFIGLIMGMSIISLVEIGAYLCLRMSRCMNTSSR